MSNLLNGLLSCICITIPEVTFMTLLIIRLCNRKELLDVYRFRENIKWYVILIIPPSLLADVLNFGLRMPKRISTISCLILLYILAIYIFDKTKTEEINFLKCKVFIALIPLYITLIMIDIGGAIIWFKYLGLTYIQITSDIFLVLKCSVSSRILEIVIATIILINRNSKIQTSVFYTINNNNFFKRFMIGTLLFLLIFEIYVMDLILFYNILQSLQSLNNQIFFTIFFVYLIPSVIFTGFYMVVKNCINIIYGENKLNNLN